MSTDPSLTTTEVSNVEAEMNPFDLFSRKIPFVHAEHDLGLVAADYSVASSYGSAVATANLAALNAFTAGGWRTYGSRSLYFPRLYAINGAWDWGSYYGFRFISNGHGNILALNQSTTIAGAIGGLFNVQPALDKMVRCRNHGTILQGMNFFGWYHPTSYSTLLAQIAANGARIGIEVENSTIPNNGVANGKITADALCIGGCITGLKLSREIAGVAVADVDQAHADQMNIMRLYTPYCTKGVHIDNHQSLGNVIHYYDTGDVLDTALEISRGGKTKVGFMSLEGQVQTGLLISGSDNLQVYGGEIKIDTLNVDGTFGVNSRAIKVTPAASAGTTPLINVGCIDVSGQPARTGHLVELAASNYGRLNIHSGVACYNGMIKCTGGTANIYSVVSVRDLMFRNGQNPNSVFASVSPSTGRVLYRHEGCSESHNVSGALNPQAFFAASESFLNLG